VTPVGIAPQMIRTDTSILISSAGLMICMWTQLVNRPLMNHGMHTYRNRKLVEMDLVL